MNIQSKPFGNGKSRDRCPASMLPTIQLGQSKYLKKTPGRTKKQTDREANSMQLFWMQFYNTESKEDNKQKKQLKPIIMEVYEREGQPSLSWEWNIPDPRMICI